jgi:hypothetical protein
MTTKNYEATISVNAAPEKALTAINNVSGWWAKHFEGSAEKLHDQFTVRFGTTFVIFEMIDLIPGDTTVWEVRDCYLPWLNDKTEWNGTRVVWVLNPKQDSTIITMTHIGLEPEAECYETCVKGWDGHIKTSLLNLINTGKGQPE